MLMAATALVVGGGIPGVSAVRPSASTVADTLPSSVTITIVAAQFGGAFQGPDTALAPGGTVTVVNTSPTEHTFTSDALTPQGKRYFDAVRIQPGQTVVVDTSQLGDGVYHFHCSYHPSMKGKLTIGTGGDISGAPDFDQPLYEPPVLRGKHLTIVMKKADIPVFPGQPKVPMWTYGGTFPGPTIVRPAGADTKVTFVNKLPTAAGSVTVHQHAGHQASADDGQPTTHLIRHGARRTYDYPLRDAGKPLPAALRFYHDHRMNVTARNNWMGLQGMFITTDPADAKRGLPGGRYSIPLAVTDRTFTPDNRLFDPFAQTSMKMGSMSATTDPGPPGTVGEIPLVNGRFAPYKDVEPGLYRLQILNSSLFSSYDFALSNGEPLEQVGTGSGLLPHPVSRQDVLLGPAQRADVVVDFRDYAGQNVLLQSIPRAGSVGSGSYPAFLMQFRVGAGPSPTQKAVRDNLLPLTKMKIPRKTAMTWKFGLSTDSHGHTFWSINGRRYNPRRIDHQVTLGKVEKWALVNTSDITHYVHLHEELWRTVSRNGAKPPPWERGYEDTWRLDPGDRVVVAARFTDFTGKFMIHCHMLDHEDDGMMATWQVVKPKKR
jgi:FtsP/CotA-like multicopper oxidase with cupredoxin domain/plastocyanin